MLSALEDEIQGAAQRVAQDWPSVTSEEELTRDLQLLLLEDDGQRSILEDLPGYRRKKFLTDLASKLVAEEVADFEQYTGNVLYSVGKVRYLLESGGLVNSRDRISVELPDLDEGCRYLTDVLPLYSRTIYAAYVYGNKQAMNGAALDAALSALTDCMNNLSDNRRKE